MLTYIANTLEALDHPDLVHMILHYLLAMSDDIPPKPAVETPLATKRQSSLVLLSGTQNDEERVDPNLFSLVDLILNGLHSRNSQTTVAALKLSTVLLNRHANYALSTLVRATLPLNTAEQRTIGALSVESEMLLNIAASISGEDGLENAYTTALQDITPPLEFQMIQQTVRPPAMLLAPGDPFLHAVSALFQSFFTNNVDVNLALTEVVMQLALRTQVSLNGWLAVSPSNYLFGDEDRTDLAVDLDLLDDDEKSAFQNLQTVQRRPHWEDRNAPVIPSLLWHLQSQVNDIRHSIANIDALIAKRIEILSGIEKDEPSTRPGSQQARGRPSSDIADNVRSYRRGESRQIQRLKPGSAVSSRGPSPGRSSTSSRVRDLAGSPTRGGAPRSLSPLPNRATPGRLSHGIFQPPPPDNPDETASLHNTEGTSTPKAPEYEAETLRRKLCFRRPVDSPTEVFRYVDTESQNTSEGQHEERGASASHVLTNFVILHYFLLELAAVLQTRAVMFDEVAFS